MPQLYASDQVSDYAVTPIEGDPFAGAGAPPVPMRPGQPQSAAEISAASAKAERLRTYWHAVDELEAELQRNSEISASSPRGDGGGRDRNGAPVSGLTSLLRGAPTHQSLPQRLNALERGELQRPIDGVLGKLLEGTSP